MCGQRAEFRFFLNLFLGLVWVCETEISQMDKNNRNPDLVCENSCGYNTTSALSRLSTGRLLYTKSYISARFI